jgi:hypothetical protein
MREGCKSSGASEAQGSGGAEKFRPGSAGVGEATKPIGGARVAVTEGEGVIAGLRKLEEETTFGKYAKATQAGMGRARARGLWEKGGWWGWMGREAGWAGWSVGRLGRK